MPIVKIDCYALECPSCHEWIDLDGDGLMGRLTEAQARETIAELCHGMEIEPGATEEETIERICGCTQHRGHADG